MLDELKSCPQVMQELAKASLNSVPHGLSHINEAYLDPDSGNEPCSDVDYPSTGNKARAMKPIVVMAMKPGTVMAMKPETILSMKPGTTSARKQGIPGQRS